MSILFKTDKYTDVMRTMSDEFLSELRARIDQAAAGVEAAAPAGSIELGGSVGLD
jgi:hypothetical protein